MRLYLDTNILVYLLSGQGENIDRDTKQLISDTSNTLYTCPVCVHEFIYLRQAGKINTGKDWKKTVTVVERLEEFGIAITPLTPKHLNTEEHLPLLNDKCDPLDRLIIAQAIADKATLVSSDRQFPNYVEHGLAFHQNIR
ncbi:MAG: type II toxin-antitoxin system VapC family toxin [Prevotella sp.]|nr:type II toxin-antitoxin system VapC family toxin [Prevotella sp.]MCD8288631.1 type II toxin-antitoxin system VapC family toxin [Prevotella sp.]